MGLAHSDFSSAAEKPEPYTLEALHEAIKKKDLGFVREILSSGDIADLNGRDKSGWTPVRSCICEASPEALELVLKAGAAAEVKPENMETPLSYAIEHYHAHSKIVRLLLEHGAKPETEACYDKAPMLQAAKGGHEAILLAMLEYGGDPNQKGYDGERPLHAAAEQGHEGIIRILAAAGADLNGANDAEQSPLEEALSHQRRGAFETLLELGANPRRFGKNGTTLLMWAAIAGDGAAVKTLVNLGLDVNARKSDDGFTPLMWAAWGGKADSTRALLALDAGVDMTNNDGKTARQLAASRGHDHVVKIIDDKLAADMAAGLANAVKVKKPFKIVLAGVKNDG